MNTNTEIPIKGKKRAILALVLGATALSFWIIPIMGKPERQLLGLPIAIIGAIMGCSSLLKHRTKLTIASVLTCVIALFSFGIKDFGLFKGSIESQIIGKWSAGENKYWEFFEDNSVVKGHIRGSGPDDGGGKWTKIDGNRIKLEFNSMFGTSTIVMDDVRFVETPYDMITFTYQGERIAMPKIK